MKSRVTYIQSPRHLHNHLKNKIKWKCKCTKLQNYIDSKDLALYDEAADMHYSLSKEEQQINITPFCGPHVIGHVNAYNDNGEVIGWLEIQSQFNPIGSWHEEWFIVLEVLPEYRGMEVPEAMLGHLVKTYWFNKRSNYIDSIDEPLMWYTGVNNHNSKHCAVRLGFVYSGN